MPAVASIPSGKPVIVGEHDSPTSSIESAVVRFFVDEDGFAFTNEDRGQLEHTLEMFVDLLDAVEETGQVMVWGSVWDIEAASGRTLADLLFVPGYIDNDVRRLVGVRIDKLLKFDETLNPDPTSICDGQTTGLSPSIALCAAARREGRAAGCLTTDQSGRRGHAHIGDGAAWTVSVPFLVDVKHVRTFWRFVLDVEWPDLTDIESIAPWAYPRSRFAPGVWGQVRRFAGPADSVRVRLLHNLAGLDDYAVDIWQRQVQANLISGEMRALAEVDCSPESPKTHSDDAAMRERDVDFGSGLTLRCEWHAKFEPTRNRIHFKVHDNQVYIGIFAEHLTIPK